VPDEQWVSQQDAAKRLGVTLPKVGMLIANDHLDGAGNSSDDMGVTVDSLEAELVWRQSASVPARVRRIVRDLLHWV